MSFATILDRFKFRRGTAANLATVNETPLAGEAVWATDAYNFKIGDEATAFNSLRWLLPLFAAGSGTNTITATFTAKPVLYDGLTIGLRAAATNTGAVTFNPNSLGAVAVTKLGGVALAPGDIPAAGYEAILRYRSSVPTWELLNPAVPVLSLVEGRLTLQSGVPVSTADQTGKTTVYFTPYKGNRITLWDTATWATTTFTETSLALGTVISGLPYDVFGYLSGGVLTLEKLAWTNGTTRATAVTLQDGRYCKSGDKTRLYLGTFYTTSTTTTEDSRGGVTTNVGGKRFLWNYYNRARRDIVVIDTTDNYSYTTATIRQANATAGNKVEMIIGIAEDVVFAQVGATVLCGANTGWLSVGVGLDSTTGYHGSQRGTINQGASGAGMAPTGIFSGLLAAGYHYLSWNEKGGGGTSLFIGDNGGAGQQSGLIADVWC